MAKHPLTYDLTLDDIAPVTHDTYRLRMARPDGYVFRPGQACMLAVDRNGWRDEARPFTFTSMPEDDQLEFVIKTYPEHDGVTEQIADLAAGDGVRISDCWGAITDKGPGLFIAGGAGVTPFIAILRDKQRKDALAGSTLLFSNSKERDIILQDEWDAMRGLHTVYTLTDEHNDAYAHGQIDMAMLQGALSKRHEYFYICGPDPMIDAVRETLLEMGIRHDRIVTEDGH